MEIWTVYILNCADGKTYKGCTHDFPARLAKHQRGEVESTKSRLPVSVCLKVEFSNKHKAYAFEKYLKSGSGCEFTRRHFL
ncbi:MAG: GIY-YIG nuclease family protein [Bacteroidetes bacterium]|nr:GIY-YIG nuclease family protein [Bacteroidota bacterium]